MQWRHKAKDNEKPMILDKAIIFSPIEPLNIGLTGDSLM